MQAPPKLRVESLARECADLPPELRYARLDEECNGDEEFRKEVEASIRKQLESQKTDILTNDYEKAIPGHYKLIELLGRGGMAEVFRAKDTRLDRSVAIKFLNSEFRKDPERMRRFNQEARAVSALNHPNILVIHDVGENEGIQYIVTEFVDGETLSRRILRGSIPLHEAVEIAIQIASALAASHKAGIVHRDIKPDNVMIRRDGVVKVLDFGLAKESIDPALNAIDANAATLDKALTSPGLILGTPQYMSPEQARGRQLDARTDIFSLGIIIFEMASGRPPFQGGSMVDVIASIISKDTPRLEDHMADPPESLCRIVDKSLRKNVEERYGTMDSLMSDLKDAQRELAGRVYDGKITGGTEVRTTLQNTAETEPFHFKHWNAAFATLALISAGLLLWWYVGFPGRATNTGPSALRTIPITSWSSETGELSSSTSFSPDGKMIAFDSTRDGSTEIWLKPTVGGDPIQITKNGHFNHYPVWSPSGQEIAFFSNRGGSRGLWRTSFTGGQQIEVAGGLGEARPVRWSQGGKIYVQDQNELFSFDERSGQKAKLTDFATLGLKPRTIELSPDESKLAYSIQEGEIWKIYEMSVGSKSGVELAASKDLIHHIAWRPDNRSLVFSMSIDGNFQLFEAGPGIESPRQITNGGTDFVVQDVADDDSKILFASVTETSDLWTVNTQTQEEKLVAGDTAAEYWPDVSPDGKNIVFQSVRQVGRPRQGSIGIAGTDGIDGPRMISKSGFAPTWSVDGQWIAFFKSENGKIGLWRVRPGGDEATRIVEEGVTAPGQSEVPYLKFSTHHLSWSPDGTRLAFLGSVDGVKNVWIAETGSSAVFKVTTNEDDLTAFYSPYWTSDGKTLVISSSASASGGRRLHRILVYEVANQTERKVFETNQLFRFLGLSPSGEEALIAMSHDPKEFDLVPSSTDVYSISLESGLRQNWITLDRAYFDNIHLSRDRAMLAFVSRRENITALWTVPVNGGTPKRLLTENDPKILFSSLAWSPDGKFIVFGKQTRTNLISMLAK